MKHKPFTILTSLAIAGLAALSLAGCGSSDQGKEASAPSGENAAAATTQAKEPASGASEEQGEVKFSYGEVAYTAKLQSCALVEAEDALFHGPAFDATGAVVGYLSGDFTGLGDSASGEARINFGATKNMQSTDKFVAMGDVRSDIVITDSSDTSLIVMGGAWEQDGTKLPVATLNVSC
ncbi:hypothetical protein [Arthrobacter sp. MYb227]|uniref:hypothetical protein n=1 Tax=Arthrobacter sp. MYb227 TaxID=1848601 RepID=UPI0011B0D184|nr:hypothetical protein [Arthrobacter sp. MYb227]